MNEAEQLRQWKAAVLGCCKACDGFDTVEWGGDKEGWGFVMYFISHLNTRALHAETVLAEQDSRPAQGAPIEAEYVKKVAKALRAGIGLGGPAAADLIETLYLAALPALTSTDRGGK